MNKPIKPAAASAGGAFYASSRTVYPKSVDGRFRRLKWLIMAVTLAIYYGTPWLRWDRGAFAPNQAVLVDLAGRRFYMFGIEIWPHEFYFVAGLLIMAGVGLFLITSAVGRAWCGFACPQTVWTDLFQHVDRWVDGDRNAQIRLANASWGPAKFVRRAIKWAMYLTIAFWTGGAWVMYFADAPTLTVQFWSGTAAPVAYASVAVLTATTFILGGFMREQVCIYMCPWPRIQTAMMDEDSLTVTYKGWRGEPRASVKSGRAAVGPVGDCIDCNQCVNVCPTGIDIREGPQIGCITCALCIDACDTVMAQVGRPRGLIDYATLTDAKVEIVGGTGRPMRQLLFRPRTIAYFTIWGAIGLALLFLLGDRERLDISASQLRNPPFVQLSDGSIRNSYLLRLRNMETRPRNVDIAVSGIDGAVMWRNEGGSRTDAATQIRVLLAPDATTKVPVFVVAPDNGRSGSIVQFTVTTRDAQHTTTVEPARFSRPGGSE